MAASTETAPMTADELARLPDDGWRYELIEGGLIRMTPAGGVHGEVGTEVHYHLRAFAGRHRLGRVYAAETGFLIARNPDTVLAPDVAFVRAERLPPRRDRRGFMPIAPDLVVEVVSPSDQEQDVAKKVARYLAAGVPLVWVARPEPRTVTVHTPDEPPRVLRSGDVLDGGDVLPGLALPVGELFV